MLWKENFQIGFPLKKLFLFRKFSFLYGQENCIAISDDFPSKGAYPIHNNTLPTYIPDSQQYPSNIYLINNVENIVVFQAWLELIPTISSQARN